jgi:hypothetical protein
MTFVRKQDLVWYARRKARSISGTRESLVERKRRRRVPVGMSLPEYCTRCLLLDAAWRSIDDRLDDRAHDTWRMIEKTDKDVCAMTCVHSKQDLVFICTTESKIDIGLMSVRQDLIYRTDTGRSRWHHLRTSTSTRTGTVPVWLLAEGSKLKSEIKRVFSFLCNILSKRSLVLSQ